MKAIFSFKLIYSKLKKEDDFHSNELSVRQQTTEDVYYIKQSILIVNGAAHTKIII